MEDVRFLEAVSSYVRRDRFKNDKNIEKNKN